LVVPAIAAVDRRTPRLEHEGERDIVPDADASRRAALIRSPAAK
jgi:hypothetical protein